VTPINPFAVLEVIGVRSAFWYGVYRWQLAGGSAKKRTPCLGWDDLIRELPGAALDWDPRSGRKFFFTDTPGLRRNYRQWFPKAEAGLRAEWSEAEKGNFLFWEDSFRACGFPPDWNRNPLTGTAIAAGRHWTEVGEQESGDIKGVWELSRFSIAFRLSRLYALTGEEKAADAFWRLFESWLAANPPNSGPQWISAQEVALRALAWIFALHALESARATTPERVRRMMAALEAHGRRIEATPAYARAQNNNHLISEATGLFTLGLLFPALPRARQWCGEGKRWLAESAAQFFPDGGYIQHSHNYHRLALQLCLWSVRLAELNNIDLPEGVSRGVGRSIELLQTLADPRTGRISNFGHNDGALFLPLNTCAYEDYRPVLQAAALWRSRNKIYGDGPWDEDAFWLLGAETVGGMRRTAPRDVEYLPKPFAAPCAGLYVLAGKESQAVIRCVRFHNRPAHSDQLHVDLWWRGENVAADAGSYLYSGEPPWRNSLAGAAVHNTVTVDGMDPMRHTGRFLWTHIPRAVVGLSRAGVWSGSHDGYRRRGILHRRTVEQAGEDVWIITDDILGRGLHTVRLHWLIPDYPWEGFAPEQDPALRNTLSEQMTGWKDGTGGGLKLETPAGGISLRFWASRSAAWNLFRAGKRVSGPEVPDNAVSSEVRGWRSLRYANKIPALSQAGIATGDLPIRFISLWTPL
jgi:hypothetical protein